MVGNNSAELGRIAGALEGIRDILGRAFPLQVAVEAAGEPKVEVFQVGAPQGKGTESKTSPGSVLGKYGPAQRKAYEDD